MTTSDDANVAFGDANVALLVGARPRSKGMERKDLLEANGAIFTVQGKALSDNAAPDIRVLVVGNPANTNALIAMNNAPNIAPERFTAMTRLDQNRAQAQLAASSGRPVADVTNMTIWGNHSATQYPDVFRARIGGRPGPRGDRGRRVDREGVHPDRPATRRRHHRSPRALRARRPPPTPPSTTSTTGSLGTAAGDWVSMAIPSDGSYGVPEGLISSFPVTTSGGGYQIVQGLDLEEFSRARIDASVGELAEERDAVRELGLVK